MKTTIYILIITLLGFQNSSYDDPLGKYISTSQVGTTHAIVFSSNKKFNTSFHGGVAAVKCSGKYELITDTIFITYDFPAISNNIDTFHFDNHYQNRRDTFWIIDENIIADNSDDIFGGYFQYEKHDENGNILIKKDWKVIDTTIISVNEDGSKSINVIKNFHKETGEWKYFDSKGNLIKND
jgi:hypothetical protein